jgi:hypothetical protein
MKDWPYKVRDLAIADRILTRMASMNNGRLCFLEEYQVDKKTQSVTFKFPPWVDVLVNAYKSLYSQDELPAIIEKVLDETLKQFNGLEQEQAELFKELVGFSIAGNPPDTILH